MSLETGFLGSIQYSLISMLMVMVIVIGMRAVDDDVGEETSLGGGARARGGSPKLSTLSYRRPV